MLPPIERVSGRFEDLDLRPQAIRAHTDTVLSETANSQTQERLPKQPLVLPTSSSSPILMGLGIQTVQVTPPRLSERAATFSELSTKPPNVLKKASPVETRSVSLAVPYANTTALTRPTWGDRPVQAASTINGVPKHAKTSTPMHDSTNQKRKSRNLLNPVNLLRRRSSQIPPTSPEEGHSTKVLTVPPMNLPDDYDPAIRGNVVHDFSAPRPKRSPSSNDNVTDSSQASATAAHANTYSYEAAKSTFEQADQPVSVNDSASKRASDRVPIFTEQLDDQRADDKRSSAVNAEALANTGFLSRVSWQSQQEQDPFTLPSFARKSQQLDPHQAQHSMDAWKTRLSDPSTISSQSRISSQSAISALSAFPQPVHRAEEQDSPVSPEDSLHDRFSQPMTDLDASLTSPSPEVRQPRSPPILPPRSPDDSPAAGNGLPKHFKSNSSRFSFQIAGQDSIAEEKLLEERHKLKSNDAGEEVASPKNGDEDEEEEEFFDEDAMYDRDEFDDSQVFEHVHGTESHPRDDSVVKDTASPGLIYGADSLSRQSAPHGQAPDVLDSPPATAYVRGQQDASSVVEPEQVVMQEPVLDHNEPRPASPMRRPSSSSDYGDESGMNELQREPHGTGADMAVYEQQSSPAMQSRQPDNDMYFNDGMIDPSEDRGGPTMNEDDFDDPSFLQRSLSQGQDLTLSPYSANRVSDVYDVHGQSFYMQDAKQAAVTYPSDSPLSDEESHKDVPAKRQVSRADGPPTDQIDSSMGSLHGLAAYHSALADAAQNAAASGRFTRHPSVATTTSASQYSQYSTRPGTSDADKSVPATTTEMQPPPQPRPARPFVVTGPRESYSGFDFGFSEPAGISTASPLSRSVPVDAVASPEATWDDHYLSDDDIISEANADALASDDEGFYGQEFGFYAKARGNADDAEATNGGYFGTPGVDMIERKWSVKEPNLTPITERSEFSTRNSFVGPFSPGAMSMSSPAFSAQMARMSPLAYAQFQEEGMSIEELMKHKSQMFGNADGRLRTDSMSSSISGNTGYSYGFGSSPQVGPWAGSATHLAPKGGVPMVFQYSTDSSHSSMARSQAEMMRGSQDYSQSPAADTPGSARASNQSLGLAFDPDSTPRKPLPTPITAADSPIQHQGITGFNSSPKKGKGHSRSHSGADSVTYVREQSAEGAERWVLERRRTSQAGLVELVGREVVESGRI